MRREFREKKILSQVMADIYQAQVNKIVVPLTNLETHLF